MNLKREGSGVRCKEGRGVVHVIENKIRSMSRLLDLVTKCPFVQCRGLNFCVWMIYTLPSW